MGLDMYLTKEVFIGGEYEHREVSGVCKIILGRDKINLNIPIERIGTIILEVGYWRKANHIHDWFVKNVQSGTDDCGRYYVSLDKLKELKKLCKDVIKNTKLAGEVLPTKSGFFFGGTDYDEYYIEDCKNTIKIIDKALNDKISGDLYYQSSW